ncbi:DUF1015 domain-containing protein [Myxococcota bacterium]|nr:DUF1015 domain-containing protein [Myxococcota bacterium]
MTNILPFKGLRFDVSKTDLKDILVPPYDVVQPEERSLYYERSPYNAIRLELTRDKSDEDLTDYSEVRQTLDNWRNEAVLLRDETPLYYALRQRFQSSEGDSYQRLGFFGALRLEPYENSIVLPHERTLAGPKRDRLKILRATQANMSSVMMLYEDRADTLCSVLDQALCGAEAVRAIDDSGINHTFCPLRDPEMISEVTSFMANRQVVIADGHHRYETALTYRDERRSEGSTELDVEQPWDRTLAYFTNAFSEGSLLLPIHRLLKDVRVPRLNEWKSLLPNWSMLEVRLSSPDNLDSILNDYLSPLKDRPAFAADDGTGSLLIFHRNPSASVSIRVIHEEVIEGALGLSESAVRDGALGFKKSVKIAAREVRRGSAALGLYLNALTPDDVFRVTRSGDVLPQKSTFFYPKLPSGLVFRPHEV